MGESVGFPLFSRHWAKPPASYFLHCPAIFAPKIHRFSQTEVYPVLNFDDEPRRRIHIEIIPMIDVMMFLLVFFVMISLNVIPLSGFKTQLPQASKVERMDLAKHLVITLASDGHVEIEGTAYDLAQLPEVVRQQALAHPKLDVIVNGDREARIDGLVRIMDIVRAAGIQQVAIAAKKSST